MVCCNPDTAPINRHTHTHNGLACKVCTTGQAQSHTHTASLSLIIHYTRRNAHTGDKNFKKGIVVDILALKNRHILKNGQQKNLQRNDLQKTANPKIVRPTNLKYGQISEIWPQYGQSGDPAPRHIHYDVIFPENFNAQGRSYVAKVKTLLTIGLVLT